MYVYKPQKPVVYREASFKKFKKHREGEYIELETADDLLYRQTQVMETIGYLGMYIDRAENIVWLSGIGIDEDTRYIYYLKGFIGSQTAPAQ